jgi:hypothetical protein
VSILVLPTLLLTFTSPSVRIQLSTYTLFKAPWEALLFIFPVSQFY